MDTWFLTPCSIPYTTTINFHNSIHRKKLRHSSLSIIIFNSSTKDTWRKTPKSTPLRPALSSAPSFHQPYRRKPEVGHLDHSIDMDELVLSINQTENEHELFAVLSPYKNRQLSVRFMVTVLSRETDWQRSLALLDWMNEHALYTPSVYAYNVVLRNVLRAKQWEIAYGLFVEMRQRALSPDRYTYSTLITQFGKDGKFDDALSWLQKMEQDHVSGDLVLYSNLIELSRKLCDYSKAISIFSRLKQSGISPDLVAYNSMINVFGKAKLFREARLLLQEMSSVGVNPDTVSYSTLLSMYAENQKFLEALSVFSEMKEVNCSPDLTTCNIMIDVYGQLDMAKEADRLFWSMRKMGIEQNVVSYNTLLRVYGEAELFGEAIHLFRLMQRKDIDQNVVTYNTMIKIYGKTLEHEKANNLIQEMQSRGIEPNGITYSTIISIWDKTGKLDRAATLFQKLRSTGVEIDQVLYQTMIVAYERAGLVGHAKRLLHELKTPDNIPRATAITILAAAGRVEEATWVFRQAYNSGEIKDISVYACMVDLLSRNRKHTIVIEVFDKMRKAGYLPDSNVIALVLNAYGKLREFEKANDVYTDMKHEGCVFPDEVHFQMLSLYGAKRDFEMVESLFKRLDCDHNINKKELHLVVANIYERANRLNDASRIVNRMKHIGLLRQKMEVLKKVYADIILNTAKEAAAQALESERKVLRQVVSITIFVNTKGEAIRMLLRFKQMIDVKTTEAETTSLSQQKRIKELDAQLNEIGVIVDLRAKIRNTYGRLEEMDNSHKLLSNVPSENKHTHQENTEVTEHFRCSSQCGKSCNSSKEIITSGPNLTSMIIGNKDHELYRNGYAHRIRAIERNLINGKNISKRKGDDRQHGCKKLWKMCSIFC